MCKIQVITWPPGDHGIFSSSVYGSLFMVYGFENTFITLEINYIDKDRETN
jgi:hypothetical protein